MQNYLQQLLADIDYAVNNISMPFAEKELHLHDWVPDEEEEKTAPTKNLEEWTGIGKEMLPPETMLNDEQVNILLEALKKNAGCIQLEFCTADSNTTADTVRNHPHQF